MAAQARTWKNLETHRCRTPLGQDPSVPSRVRLSEKSGPTRSALGGSGLTTATCATRQLRLRMTPFFSGCGTVTSTAEVPTGVSYTDSKSIMLYRS